MTRLDKPDEITKAIREYAIKHTTVSSNATTRLIKQLLDMGLTTVAEIDSMTPDQLNQVTGYAQRKLLRFYRGYLFTVRTDTAVNK